MQALGVDAVRADDGPGREAQLRSDQLFVYSSATTAAPTGLAYPRGLVSETPDITEEELVQELVPDSSNIKSELLRAAAANDDTIAASVERLDKPLPYSTINKLLNGLISAGYVRTEVGQSSLASMTGNLQSEHISPPKITESHDAVEAGELLSFLVGDPHGHSSRKNRHNATSIYGRTLVRCILI
jgi:hypothetical protein